MIIAGVFPERFLAHSAPGLQGSALGLDAATLEARAMLGYAVGVRALRGFGVVLSIALPVLVMAPLAAAESRNAVVAIQSSPASCPSGAGVAPGVTPPHAASAVPVRSAVAAALPRWRRSALVGGTGGESGADGVAGRDRDRKLPGERHLSQKGPCQGFLGHPPVGPSQDVAVDPVQVPDQVW